jgi:hypothetical protein
MISVALAPRPFVVHVGRCSLSSQILSWHLHTNIRMRSPAPPCHCCRSAGAGSSSVYAEMVAAYTAQLHSAAQDKREALLRCAAAVAATDAERRRAAAADANARALHSALTRLQLRCERLERAAQSHAGAAAADAADAAPAAAGGGGDGGSATSGREGAAAAADDGADGASPLGGKENSRRGERGGEHDCVNTPSQRSGKKCGAGSVPVPANAATADRQGAAVARTGAGAQEQDGKPECAQS